MEDETEVEAHDSTEQEEADLDTADEQEGESVEEIKTRLAKAEELAKNYKIRAEKAEKLAKQKPNEVSKQADPAIDNATLARIYDIPEEDFDEVLDMAKFKKISLAEALKLTSVKAILAEKAEFRKTAETSNTGSSRRSPNTVTDDTLLSNASKGIIPEAGSAEAERLFWAKRGGKR